MKVVGSMLKKMKKICTQEYELDKVQKLCLYVFIFLVGAIIGFIYEELFCLIVDKEIVYRGFLYGPYLPVYGFGAIIMIPLLKKYKKNPIIIFFAAMIITGIVEYITGYAMLEIYNKRWWDYTGLFLNIDGHVCLRSVLTFAIGAIMLIYTIEPLLSKLISNKDRFNLLFISTMIVAIFIIDFSLTLLFRNTL